MIAIGVDIGGTSIKGAFINEQGTILNRFSMKVDKDAAPEGEVAKLCDLIVHDRDELKTNEEIKGIGIGIPGILDMDEGIIVSSPNLPTWDGFNIKAFMEKKLKYKVLINNDANVAALGEAKFGSGKNYKDLIMITLGTGVGGGVIINGKLFDGNKHQGAELGHMVIRMDGKPCGCGRRGCFEAYASASALIRDTKAMMKKHPISMLTEIEKELVGIDGRNAFLAAKRGDKYGQKLVDNYVKYLSEGLINYCNIFRPEAIILSGGIANEKEYLIDKVVEYLEKHTYGMKGSPKVKILNGQLGYDSGKIGAASLVLFE